MKTNVQKSLGRLVFVFAILGCSIGTAYSQTNTPTSKTSIPDTILKDMPPMYPGGYEALWNYFQEEFYSGNVFQKYLLDDQIVITFEIATDGSIDNVNVLKGTNSELDLEVLRIAKSMTHWQPAVQNGTLVKANYFLPLTFNWEQIAEYDDYGY